MIWIFIVGGGLMLLFFSTKREEIARVDAQGGLYFKYKELIDNFLEIPDIVVEKRTSTKMVLAVKNQFVITRFTIMHGFQDVSVLWEHTSVAMGNHSLNWTFPESMPQSLMMDKVSAEMNNYERHLLG